MLNDIFDILHEHSHDFEEHPYLWTDNHNVYISSMSPKIVIENAQELFGMEQVHYQGVHHSLVPLQEYPEEFSDHF